MKDYYYILGVPRTATASEIKTAYRKLSLKFHPDKNGGDRFFEDRFKDINEAHEVLSEVDSRLAYNYHYDAYFANRNGQTAYQTGEPNQPNQQRTEPEANADSQNKDTNQSRYQQSERTSGPSSKDDTDQTTTGKTAGTAEQTAKGTYQEYVVLGVVVACLVSIMAYVINHPMKSAPAAPVAVYTSPPPTYSIPSGTPNPQLVLPPQNSYQENGYQGNSVTTGDGYFSIGSTKKEVLSVQGTPTTVNKSDFFDEWSYGLSSIDFENGRVKSYHNIAGNLRVQLRASRSIEKGNGKDLSDYFTLGSTKEQVLLVQGTPSAITKSDFFDEWSYGLSSIDFEGGAVRSYHNISGNLQVIMRPKSAAGYSSNSTFSIGSTKDEVLAVQGTPTAVQKSDFFDEWSYGLSSIDFEHGRVKSYHNISDNLHVSMAGAGGNY